MLWRTWSRVRIPWFLIDLGVADKGRDCEAAGGWHLRRTTRPEDMVDRATRTRSPTGSRRRRHETEHRERGQRMPDQRIRTDRERERWRIERPQPVPHRPGERRDGGEGGRGNRTDACPMRSPRGEQ